MKNNLEVLHDGIEAFDNNAKQSLFFYNNPTARLQLIADLLTFSVQQIDKIDDPVALRLRVHEILKFIDINFHQYSWPAHEVHFHTNFLQHASCTFTCLNELSTIIEKLIKEKFAA